MGRRQPAIAYLYPPVPADPGVVGQPQVFAAPEDSPPSAPYTFIWAVLNEAGTEIIDLRVQPGGGVPGPVDVDGIRSIVNAAGELMAGIGDDLLDRVPAPTASGHVLTANLANATKMEWGPPSLRANQPIPDIVAPGNNVEIVSFSAPGANSMRGARIIIPSWATRLRELWVPIGTASGNVRGAVYDVGATTAAVRTRIFDGASTPAVAGWTLLGDPNMAVTGGQHLDVAAIGDNATVTFGRRTLAGGGEQALPTAVAMVNGVQYKVTWSNAAGSFTNPATLNEGAAATGVSGLVPIIARLT